MSPFARFLRRYAEGEAAAVAPYVVGRRLLDLGAGEAWAAPALRRHTGAWVCSVDVGPFRRAAGPYVAYDGRRLPFGDGAFDTTVLLLVLHHCRTPDAVLDEALRVTGARLIVVESVYRNRVDRFWLDLLDGRLNRFRLDGRMSAPRAFRTPGQWAGLFASRGLREVERRWLGSRWERVIHHPLLYALDK